MSTLLWVKLYLLTVPVFFVIDMFWLGFFAKDFYRAQIGFLLRPEFNWVAAILFYLIFIGGVIFFAVVPALEFGGWQRALLYGALFGFMTYATYDLTNLATVRDWPLTVTVVDLVWGTVLSGLVALGSYRIGVFLQS
ncbi:MAG: DUF2177 family protein [Candidatus Moraniibacteriota bacterium]